MRVLPPISLLVSCFVFSALSRVNLISGPLQAVPPTAERKAIRGDQTQKENSGQKPGSQVQHAQAIIQRARRAFRNSDRKRALGILASIPAQDGAGHFAAGQMLVEEEAYAEAAREFGLARRTYKDRYTAGYDEALAFLNAGDCGSAIHTANELLNQGFQTAELADVAAMAYLKCGKKSEAYNAYRLATHLDPKDEDAYVGLSEIALDRDNYDLGAEVANIGLSHLPNSERLLVERGVMHAMKGESSDADRDFLAASKLVPADPLPAVCSALVAMQNGNLDQAVRLLHQAASQHPENYFAQFWFAEALMHAGAATGTPDDDEVLHALQISVRDNPDFWHSRTELGKVLLAHGDVDGAILELKRAAELNPKATSPLYLLAQAYRKKGDEGKATELLARVNTMQAEEREAQTIPKAAFKNLLQQRTASPSTP